ncbi:MAG: ABC transporter permease [Actinomycetota bacterium]|nr:ABC transporter permease [Actinomycetota bacterium]
MIALIRSEFLRLRSRRVLMTLTALGAAGIVVGMSIAAVKSHPGLNGLALSSLPDVLKHVSFILVVFGLVIGASSVGADWQTGSMATLLTWEPRRTRVFFARLLVVIVTVLLLAVALETLLALLFLLVANTRGTTAFAGGVGRAATGAILRVGAMASVGSVLGACIAMLGRSSTAALGAVFVYLAVVENLLRGLYPGITKWTFAVNAVVFVDGKPATLFNQILTFGRAVAMLVGYAGIVIVAGLTSFRTRDVD